MKDIIRILDQIKTNKLSNYVIAGLDSYLIANGKVRLFENSRDHQDSITPHTHRFDFTCLVLEGTVTNRIWYQSQYIGADEFLKSTIEYSGEVGQHKITPNAIGTYTYRDTKYSAGETYSMKAEQFHSIFFSRGAKVLFFEGEDKSTSSEILEPVVNGQIIATCENKDYMFIKDNTNETK